MSHLLEGSILGAADTASHLPEVSYREWKPVRGGPSFDTLLRVLSCIVFGQTILDCDKPVVPHPEAVMPFPCLVLYRSLPSSNRHIPGGQCLSLRALRGLTIQKQLGEKSQWQLKVTTYPSP